MKDRVVQYPHRYQLMPVSGQNGVYDLIPVPGTVTEAGTALDKATLLSDETADMFELRNKEATVDMALRHTFGFGSYLAFVANAGAESIEAALGKNNESKMFGIGKALAMYAWYKEQDKSTYPFNRLTFAQTLKAACEDPTVREIEANEFLTQFLMSYEYSQKELVNKMPVPAAASGAEGVVLGYDPSAPYDMSTNNTVKTFQVTADGIYSLMYVMSGQATSNTRFAVNGSAPVTVPGLYDSLTPVKLKAGDTVTCTMSGYSNDPSRRGCMFLGAVSKLTNLNYEPSAGDVMFYMAKGKSITMPFNGTFILKAFTKTVNTGSTLSFTITKKNGTVKQMASTNATNFSTHVLTDGLEHYIETGDIISLTAAKPSVMSDYAICLYADAAYHF